MNHKLNSGRSKCNLLVLSHVSYIANIQQPIPRQDTWQLGLQLSSKSQGTSNGLRHQDPCMTLCHVVTRYSELRTPRPEVLDLCDLKTAMLAGTRRVVCALSNLKRPRRPVLGWGTCACVTRNLPCHLIRGGAAGTVAHCNAACCIRD